jgi:hypothetical protein
VPLGQPWYFCFSSSRALESVSSNTIPCSSFFRRRGSSGGLLREVPTSDRLASLELGSFTFVTVVGFLAMRIRCRVWHAPCIGEPSEHDGPVPPRPTTHRSALPTTFPAEPVTSVTGLIFFCSRQPHRLTRPVIGFFNSRAHQLSTEVVVTYVAPTATFTGPESVTYGQATTVNFTHSFDPSSADTAAGFTYSYSLNGADFTAQGVDEDATFTLDAGEHTVYGRVYDKDGAYTEYETTVTVEKANASFSYTGYAGGTYNGVGNTRTVSGVGGTQLYETSLSGTDAGNYSQAWSFSSGNYNLVNDTLTFTIEKANATISVNGYSLTYDGNAHTATGAATGVKGETLAGLNLAGTTHTDAGAYSDTWTFTDAGLAREIERCLRDAVPRQLERVRIHPRRQRPLHFVGRAEEPVRRRQTVDSLMRTLEVVQASNTRPVVPSRAWSFILGIHGLGCRPGCMESSRRTKRLSGAVFKPNPRFERWRFRSGCSIADAAAGCVLSRSRWLASSNSAP